MATTRSPDETVLERRRRRTLAAVSLALFCVQLDFFALTLALPSIASGLGAGTDDAQWVLSAYMLSLGALLVAGGRIGDLLGRRRVLCGGIALFGIASAICALAPSLHVLVAARVLQGAGAAVMLPGAVAVLTNAYPPDRSGRAIGLAFGISGIGNALGPFVGGILTDALSWHWVFWFNVPFVLAALALAATSVSESRDPNVPRAIDVPGLVTVTLGIAALSFGINRGPDWGWGSPATIGTLLGALALLGLFVAIERRVRRPLVDLRLFRRRAFVALTAAGAVSNAAYGVMVFGVTVYLQDARGYSALAAGVMFLGPSLAAAAAGPLSGTLGRRWAAPLVMGGAIATAAGGMLALSLVEPLAPFLALMALGGLGFGLAYAFVNVATQAVVPAERAGEASGVVLAIVVTVGGIGVVVAGTLIDALTAHGDSEANAIRVVLALFAGLALAAATALVALRRAGSRRSA